jgi:hypothetical protein
VTRRRLAWKHACEPVWTFTQLLRAWRVRRQGSCDEPAVRRTHHPRFRHKRGCCFADSALLAGAYAEDGEIMYKLRSWHQVDTVLRWFMRGCLADEDAVLIFSSALTKQQRADLHECVRPLSHMCLLWWHECAVPAVMRCVHLTASH